MQVLRQGETVRPAAAHDHLLFVSALAARSATIQSFIQGIGTYLSDLPLCAERVFVSLQTLHPAFRARTYLWKKQRQEVRIVEWPHGLTNRPGYYDSPDYHVHSSGAEFRIQNLHEIQGHGCELYGKLRDEGYTDYLMVPLVFSDGTVNTLSIATKLRTGFPHEELVRFRELIDLITVTIERYSALETIAITLGTYLGQGASREVMRGRIQAGHGETIRAGILLADMHDFTGHASRLGPSATVQLLNTYFDCLVGPIEETGGHVLKFIGDAVLGCFPVVPGEPAPDPVGAIRAMRKRLGKLNDVRSGKGEPPIRHGVGLHFGEVVFGNIGSSERLDFTIIGEAVNVAARCAEETRALDVGYLATGDFVTQFGVEAFAAIGAHTLRGFAQPLALFVLAEEAGRVRRFATDDQGAAPGATPQLSIAAAANGG